MAHENTRARSNLGVSVCRRTEPILNEAATFDQYGTLVFAAVLSLARWYSNKTILLFLSLGRVHQKPLLVNGFGDERNRPS
jgi:hypothetical protein